MSELLAKPRKTSAFQRLMSVHWWMSIAYLILFVGGTIMSQLSGEVSWRMTMYDFHKSIGVISMALLTWRILILLQVWWKKYSKRLPKLTLPWWRNVVLHTLMYVLMWVVPMTGFFLSNSFRPKNVKLFGLVLPDLFPQNSAVIELGRSLHFWTAYTFLVFVILHAIVQWKVVRAKWRRFRQFVQR